MHPVGQAFLPENATWVELEHLRTVESGGPAAAQPVSFDPNVLG